MFRWHLAASASASAARYRGWRLVRRVNRQRRAGRHRALVLAPEAAL